MRLTALVLLALVLSGCAGITTKMRAQRTFQADRMGWGRGVC